MLRLSRAGRPLGAPAVGLFVLLWVTTRAPESSELPRDSIEQSRLRIEFQVSRELPEFGTVTVEGLSPKLLAALEESLPTSVVWTELFAIYTIRVSEACPAAGVQPAVLGNYSVDASTLRFRPRFPFVVGLQYCARFSPSALEPSLIERASAREVVEAIFTLPPPEHSENPRVDAVYPSTKQVPANLLRIYVHFSAPMWGKDVDRYIHLYDAAGEEVFLPFVEIPEGLWDPTGTRLTLFFHPGRIKRGVGPNIALGTPLREGASYRLVVDAGLQRIDGATLSSDFERKFLVGPEDRKSPDPQEWQINSPSGGADPLEVVFPESLDHALLRRMIWVVDGNGRALDGTITLEAEETRWVFSPTIAWASGEYAIRVDSALEDLAGNAIGHLFEEGPGSVGAPDTTTKVDSGGARETRTIPFHIR